MKSPVFPLDTFPEFSSSETFKARAKKERGVRGRGEKETSPPHPSFFLCSRLKLRAAKTSKFARKPRGNAWYASYIQSIVFYIYSLFLLMSFTARKNESDKIIITLLNKDFKSPRLENISIHHRVRKDHGRT